MGLDLVMRVDGEADTQLADAATVEVYERVGAPTTFRLQYPIDIDDGDLPCLIEERLKPGRTVDVVASSQDARHCLAKGPIRGQRIHLKHGGEGSRVDVLGADSTIVMDREIRSVIWAGVTDAEVVEAIAETYGFEADVAATTAGHAESGHALVQRSTDLDFVQRLARRNGFLFWLSCDEKRNETIHFRRPNLTSEPVLDLIINLDNPNLQTLDIEFDLERPTSTEGKQLDLRTKRVIDGAVGGTPLPLLGAEGLAAITGDIRTTHVSAPADDVGDLRARNEGALAEADWFIKASCATSVHSVGTVVRAHSVVRVRGAGSRHSGPYFVAGVRHTIDAVAHHMEIELLRNAWGG